jgi:hypothetical protein
MCPPPPPESGLSCLVNPLFDNPGHVDAGAPAASRVGVEITLAQEVPALDPSIELTPSSFRRPP